MAPFGIRGWQAAFIAVGLPGLLLALVTWRIKEPKRGLSDGIETNQHPHPFKEMLKEMIGLTPFPRSYRCMPTAPRSAPRCTAAPMSIRAGSLNAKASFPRSGGVAAATAVRLLERQNYPTTGMLMSCPTRGDEEGFRKFLLSLDCLKEVGVTQTESSSQRRKTSLCAVKGERERERERQSLQTV